jgi:hypothetical protein
VSAELRCRRSGRSDRACGRTPDIHESVFLRKSQNGSRINAAARDAPLYDNITFQRRHEAIERISVHRAWLLFSNSERILGCVHLAFLGLGEGNL